MSCSCSALDLLHWQRRYLLGIPFF